MGSALEPQKVYTLALSSVVLFLSGCASWLLYPQQGGILLAQHPHQHWASSFFFILATLKGLEL